MLPRVHEGDRAALLFVSLFVPFAYFNHSDGWNQGARLAELTPSSCSARWRSTTITTSPAIRPLIDGHYYSEKAPAIVVMALPVFTATAVAQTADGDRS